jgi:hypothetical protein
MKLDLLLVLLLLCFSVFVSAHVCIMDPHQRGNMSISEPGDGSCFLRTPFCGDVPPQNPSVNYTAGSVISFNFQQNLNHWYPENPGFFDVSISYVPMNPTAANWTVLMTIPDFAAHDMVTQTNFSLDLTLPMMVSSHAVLMIRYVSNNPLEVYPENNTQAIFYNCADIAILPPSNADEEESKIITEKKTTLIEDESISCCSPPQWQIAGHEYNSLGYVSHYIWYDEMMNMVRWDKTGNLESSQQTDKLIVITNYTTSNEYLIYPDRSECELYGADAWYSWCFGAGSGQYFVSNYSIGSTKFSEWTNEANGFTWVSYANECLPRMTSHLDDQIIFQDFKIGPFNTKEVFAIPAFCSSVEKMDG